MHHLAIFASGTGSNAQKIIDHFRHSDQIGVSLIVCNKFGAGILQIAENEKIPTLLIQKEKFFHGDAYLPELEEKEIDFIVLAGFLWKIPGKLIDAYPQKIVNLHPALLPKYGGKGMYGRIVHEAVLASGDGESGISIHYIDEVYDHGQIIFQARVKIDHDDTPESLAKKVQQLEHRYYPLVIEELIQMPNPR